MNKLNQFYKKLLESLDCEVNDEHVICKVDSNGELTPLQITVHGKERTLVFPSEELLDKEDVDWDKVAVFHPACENVFAGRSEVLNLLSDLIGFKLYAHIQSTVGTISLMASNDDLKDKLSIRQQKLITDSGIDGSKSTVALLGKVIAGSSGVVGKNKLFGIQLRRNVEVGDQKFSRVGAIKNHAKLDGDRLMGVRLTTKTAMESIPAIYNYVIDESVIGTNDRVAPYLKVLLGIYRNQAERLNAMYTTVGKYKGTMKLIDLEWTQLEDAVDEYKKYLPQSFDGSKGDIKTESKQEAVEKAPAATVKLPKQKGSLPKAEKAPKATVPTINRENPVPQEVPQQPVDDSLSPMEKLAMSMGQPQSYYPPPQMGYGQPNYGGYQQPVYQQQPMQPMGYQQGYPQQSMGYQPQGYYQQPQPNYGGYQQPMGYGQPQQQVPVTRGHMTRGY